MKASPVLIGTAALFVVLALSGCSATPPVSEATPSVTDIESASPTPTPTADPSPFDVNPDDYLVAGTPYVFDDEGFWGGDWAFYTDESKSVMCDISILSGDPGSNFCWVTPGHEAEATYGLPASAGTAADCSEGPDGYMVGMVGEPEDPTKTAGFAGCHTYLWLDAAAIAKTKVLPPFGVLTITDEVQPDESYTCSVADGAATCTSKVPAASFTFGLHVASFTN